MNMFGVVGACLVVLSGHLVQGSCPEPPDYTNADKLAFTRHVLYTCRTGSGRPNTRSVIHWCENGKWSGDPPACPKSDWEICSDGCQCDQQKKNVTCYMNAENISLIKKYAPKDTEILSIYSKPGTPKINYLPGGLLDHLKKLRKLNIEADKTGRSHTAIALETYAPLTNIQAINFQNVRFPQAGFHVSAKIRERCTGNSSCYQKCGEPTFLNPPHGFRESDRRRTIHAFYFNLKRVSGLKGYTTIYAETVVIDSQVIIPNSYSGIKIIAREVYMIGKGAIVWMPLTSQHACGVRWVKPKHGKRKLLFLEQSQFKIYAEHIQFWTRYIGGRCSVFVDSSVMDAPPPSLLQSRVVSICARILIDSGEEEDKITARNMLNAQTMYLTAPSAEKLPGKELYLSGALQLLVEIGAHERYVPYLSKEVYDRILNNLATKAGLFIDHLDEFSKKNEGFQRRKKAAEMMKANAADLLTAAREENEDAADVLYISRNALEKLKVEFESAEAELDKAREKFENGTKKYIEDAQKNFFFQLMQTVGNVMSSVFAAATGDVGALANVVSEAGVLAQTIMDLQEAVATLRSALDANKRMMKSVKSFNQSSGDIAEYMKDLDKAADLRVQVVAWDNMVVETDLVLGVGEVATIDGCSDYRLALSSMAIWGKAVTEETIRQTALVRDTLQKALRVQISMNELNRLEKAVEEIKRDEWVSENAAAAAYSQAADVKLTLIDALNLYCQSNFYYTFQECPSKPKLDDSLRRLAFKISDAKVSALTSLGKLKGGPQAFVENITLTDTVADGCTKYDQCPVAQFKKTRRVIFNLGVDHEQFYYCYRWRVEEISIRLPRIEVRPRGSPVLMAIETNGDFRDSSEDKLYYFTSAPLFRGYKYYPLTGEVTTPGKIHDAYAKYFTETSPFTTWQLTLSKRKRYNLENVKTIELTFSGSCIWKKNFRKREV